MCDRIRRDSTLCLFFLIQLLCIPLKQTIEIMLVFVLFFLAQHGIHVRKRFRWQTFYIWMVKKAHNIISLCKFFGMQSQRTSFIAISTTKAPNEHQLVKSATDKCHFMFVLKWETLFFFCFLCFLLKSVNHIKMPCGKQFVWIEFARVHTLTSIRNITQHTTHRPPMVKSRKCTNDKSAYTFSTKRNETKNNSIWF